MVQSELIVEIVTARKHDFPRAPEVQAISSAPSRTVLRFVNDCKTVSCDFIKALSNWQQWLQAPRYRLGGTMITARYRGYSRYYPSVHSSDGWSVVTLKRSLCSGCGRNYQYTWGILLLPGAPITTDTSTNSAHMTRPRRNTKNAPSLHTPPLFCNVAKRMCSNSSEKYVAF